MDYESGPTMSGPLGPVPEATQHDRQAFGVPNAGVDAGSREQHTPEQSRCRAYRRRRHGWVV